MPAPPRAGAAAGGAAGAAGGQARGTFFSTPEEKDRGSSQTNEAVSSRVDLSLFVICLQKTPSVPLEEAGCSMLTWLTSN